jgi:eukaryotic-like serine/threonine-protein kinase
VVVRKLERYELIEEIGHGGMAVVYRGRDSQLERAVAVKVLHPHLQSQPESKQRFHREAKAVARLRHPNIPEIYDYSGEGADDSYIVTELIHGPTLKQFVEGHPGMPPEVAAMVIIEVCRALECAHGQGIIHRDVKPENVMIAADGVVKLTDFGIAQVLDSHSMTVTGQILGSPAHMSPEHLEGKILDSRADVFSVGTVLYWLATGNLPFEGRNPHAVLKKIFDGDYPEPLRARPQMGETLAAIIRRCLALDPDQRYPTVTALRLDLETFLGELALPEASSLPAYFADPLGFVRRHEPAILATLVKKGAVALRAGDRSRATALFNRALAIDPRNAEVLRHVRAMVRRRRSAVGAAALGLSALALLGTWGAWQTGIAQRARASQDGPGPADRRDRSDPSRSVRIERTSNDGPSRPARTVADRDVPAKGRRAVLQASGAGALARGMAGRRTVRFVPGHVRSFDIWVDGAPLGRYGPDLLTRTLDVGPHDFRFVGAGDCCVDASWTEVVTEGEGEQRIGRALRYRPAILNVATNVHCDVEVAGRARGRGNGLISVPMNQYTESLRVVARADGYRTTETVVELRANETASVRLNLEPAAPPATPDPPGPERAKLDPAP